MDQDAILNSQCVVIVYAVLVPGERLMVPVVRRAISPLFIRIPN